MYPQMYLVTSTRDFSSSEPQPVNLDISPLIGTGFMNPDEVFLARLGFLRFCFIARAVSFLSCLSDLLSERRKRTPLTRLLSLAERTASISSSTCFCNASNAAKTDSRSTTRRFLVTLGAAAAVVGVVSSTTSSTTSSTGVLATFSLRDDLLLVLSLGALIFGRTILIF